MLTFLQTITFIHANNPCWDGAGWSDASVRQCWAVLADMDDMDTMFNSVVLITVFLFDELEKSGFGNAVSIQIF